MKKIFILFFILCATLLCINLQSVAAEHKIKFNSKTFTLKYAKQAPRITMNEYYLPEEKGYDWTELLTLLKIKEMDNPFFYAMGLAQNMPGGKLIAVKDNSIYIVAFIVTKKLSDDTFYIEPNVIKIEQSKKNVICTIQYAQKYIIKNEKEALLKIQNYRNNEENHYIELIKNTTIPVVQDKDYQSWQ